MSEKILFYRANEVPYGPFSNFDTKHPIELMNKLWPSTEHFFQAMKFFTTDNEFMEKIRTAATPRESARLGRDRSHPIRQDWESAKYQIMWMAVHEKFNKYPDLKALLLSTGDSELVEHTTNDKIWADGGNGSGTNWLGKILMDIRAKFKSELTSAAPVV